MVYSFFKINFFSLIRPLFGLRFYLTIAMPKGTWLVTTHPHPKNPTKLPSTNNSNPTILNVTSAYQWGVGHQMHI